MGCCFDKPETNKNSADHKKNANKPESTDRLKSEFTLLRSIVKFN